MNSSQQTIKLTTRKFKAIYNDPVKSAQTVDLVYVSDSQPGITRVKRGKNFSYLHQDKPVKDANVLSRIRSLVLPPAWKNVWICLKDNGHLQATGIDARGRKQYKYHARWSEVRNQAKFHRLCEFGKALPVLRARIEKDLALPGLSLNKVLAAVVSLMERTSIRVGNNMYEKLYGSFGLTTLKDKHVKLNGGTMQFSFKGKKGVAQNISIKSKRLARIVKQCRDIPGKELFQYYDENGNHKCVDSGMVNAYLKEITGEDFTAKDFRTWTGTLHALLAFKELGEAPTKTAVKKNIVAALDKVAQQLGNTRTVCKKYYVHPVVITLYEKKSLAKYFKQLDTDQNKRSTELAAEEKVMMKILSAGKIDQLRRTA